MSDLIIRDFNGHQIPQRADGYLNATAMCKANGKDYFDYERLESTKAFIDELSRSPGIPGDLVIKITKGPNAQRGTFVHPHIGYNLGQWCSPAFAVQVSQWIDDIRIKGYATAPGVDIDPMQVLNDPAAMRGLLLTYTEKVLALQAENEVLGEKAEALDRIAAADGSMCMTDAAKHLQVRPKDLIAYLSQHGWIYRRPGGGHWIGYQARIASGDLEHKVNTVLHANGEERVHEQVRVTAKGLTKLAKLLKPAVQAA